MDTKKLNMFMTVMKFSLVVIGVVLCLFLFGGANTESTVEDQEAFIASTNLSLATFFTGFIIFAGIGLILLFFVVQLITNPKKTVMSILGLLAALVVYLVFSMMGSGDTQESLGLRNPVEDGVIDSTTAGISTVIVGIVVAFLVVILGPFMGRLRKN